MTDPYSKGYVATGPIDIDGGHAFNEGDPVPDSHVSRGVVAKDQVKAHVAKAEEKPTS